MKLSNPESVLGFMSKEGARESKAVLRNAVIATRVNKMKPNWTRLPRERADSSPDGLYVGLSIFSDM
jgi:hypothetical protein